MIRRNTLLQSNVTEKPLRSRSSPRIAPLLRLEILNAQNHRSTESHQSRRVNRVFQQPAKGTRPRCAATGFPFGHRVYGERETQFYGAALLGDLRLDGRARRSRHQEYIQKQEQEDLRLDQMTGGSNTMRPRQRPS